MPRFGQLFGLHIDTIEFAGLKDAELLQIKQDKKNNTLAMTLALPDIIDRDILRRA